jgi:hypothetical protein
VAGVSGLDPFPPGMKPPGAGPGAAGCPRNVQRVTLPAFRQEVQTLRRFGVAPTIARTRWILGFQRRLVRRCECEML